jgi:hypothetical protein
MPRTKKRSADEGEPEIWKKAKTIALIADAIARILDLSVRR